MADPLGNIFLPYSLSRFQILTGLARLESIRCASMANPFFSYDMAVTGFVGLRLIGRFPMPNSRLNLCSTRVGRNAVERMNDTGGSDHQYKPYRQYSFSTHKLLLYVEYSYRAF